MKKNIISILLICVISCFIYSDIIPEGYHPVTQHIVISNIDSFPDYVVIGYITGPMLHPYEVSIIEQDVPLNKGYKFNEMGLYALLLEDLEDRGGLENIDFREVSQSLEPVLVLPSGQKLVPDDNPLILERVVYTIVRAEDGNLLLYVSEERKEFNNGQEPVIHSYSCGF